MYGTITVFQSFSLRLNLLRDVFKAMVVTLLIGGRTWTDLFICFLFILLGSPRTQPPQLEAVSLLTYW